MDREYPFLQVKKPDGEEYTIYLENIIDSQAWDICLTIGRLSDNHIVLADPQKKVSRHHCSLQYENNRWWISDRYSSNGTFLQREIDKGSKIDVRSKDKVALKSGDRILILGKLSPLGQPIFWRLEFIDPGETIQIIGLQKHGLEYSLSHKTLVRNIARHQDVVPLSKQELSLIDYMSRRNRQNGNQPAICEYNELIKAVWEDDFSRNNENIQHLVHRIRGRIETNSGKPEFLKTVNGRGYVIDLEVID